MIKIFKKDLKLFFKDKRAVLLTFLLPIVLISLFAFAFGGIKTEHSKPNPIKMLISDLDKSKTTEQIISKFDSIKGIKVNTEELEKAKILVTKGKFVGVLTFYKGFEDSLKRGKSLPVELLYDRAQEMQIGLLQPVFINTLMKYSAGASMNKSVSEFVNSNFPTLDNNMKGNIIREIGSKLEKSNEGSKNTGMQIKMTSQGIQRGLPLRGYERLRVG
jgi:ABC-2 type transport system permease protein